MDQVSSAKPSKVPEPPEPKKTTASKVYTFAVGAIQKLNKMPIGFPAYALSYALSEILQIAIRSSKNPLQDILNEDFQMRYEQRFILDASPIFAAKGQKKEKFDEYFCNIGKIKAIFNGPPGLGENDPLTFLSVTLPQMMADLPSVTTEAAVKKGLKEAISKLSQDYKEKKPPDAKNGSLLCVVET